MAERTDPLDHVLREIARRDAASAPASMDERLVAEFRAVRATHRGDAARRAVGLALAATLVAAAGSSLWLLTGRSTREPQGGTDVTTAFLPLAYSAVPYADARVVRMQVPRAALVSFGLLPPESESAKTGTVTADVIVGEDGLARAVRFVRAPRATGETP